MLTAHLPSGYLLGRLAGHNRSNSPVLIAALIGAVLPDLDMLYFHFVDFGRTHHHMYISHWPLAWLALGLLTIAILQLVRAAMLRNIAMAFFGAALLHMCLDSVAAPIYWLMPLAQGRVELVSVPAHYSHWIISYALHWTFALELTIWLAAILLYARRKKIPIAS